MDWNKRIWYLLSRNFWPLLPKFYFWKRNWTLGSGSIQVWDFPNVSQFLGNSWDNSYTMFFVLDIKYRFNCSVSNLNWKVVFFQKIFMPMYQVYFNHVSDVSKKLYWKSFKEFLKTWDIKNIEVKFWVHFFENYMIYFRALK